MIVLVRHAETEWSRDRRHTGSSDIPLTDAGRAHAAALAPRLTVDGEGFDRVLSSPLSRARETCELAGLGARAELVDALLEWDYGAYEGMTTAQIRAERPGWELWRDGCPEGEDVRAVGARVDGLVDELRDPGLSAVLFAHGHVLRVLAARWLGLPPEDGRGLALSTAALCRLGHENGHAAIWRWNEVVEGA